MTPVTRIYTKKSQAEPVFLKEVAGVFKNYNLQKPWSLMLSCRVSPIKSEKSETISITIILKMQDINLVQKRQKEMYQGIKYKHVYIIYIVRF